MPDRPLTRAEQDFADAMRTFGAIMERLHTTGAAVKAEGGDLELAMLSTIENENEKALARGSWPMLRLALGL